MSMSDMFTPFSTVSAQGNSSSFTNSNQFYNSNNNNNPSSESKSTWTSEASSFVNTVLTNLKHFNEPIDVTPRSGRRRANTDDAHKTYSLWGRK